MTMIRLSDLCPCARVCCAEMSDCGSDCAACPDAECSCGLPWDPERGAHTKSGLRLTPDVLTRILAREGQAIETEERREAELEAIRAGRRLVIGGGR